MEIKAFVEIPKHSRQKYELNEETGRIELDRTIYGPVYFPFEYGHIENTLADDGDPLDVLIITDEGTFPGCVVPCRVIGMLNMTDEKGVDNKIIAVPTAKINPHYTDIQGIDDLTEHQKNQITEFFEIYKRLEPGKWVKSDGFVSKKQAIEEVEKSIENFK